MGKYWTPYQSIYTNVKWLRQRCSESFVTRDLQIKIMGYHYTPTRLAKIQKTRQNLTIPIAGKDAQ